MSESRKTYLVCPIPAQELTPAARVERIRSELRNAQNSYLNAAFDLRAARENQEWLALGLADFGAYCAHLDIGEGWASDLIHISYLAERFEDYRPRMLDVGVSKMRLLLPHVPEPVSEEQLDTMLDMASEKSWNDLRHELKQSADDAPLPPAVDYCPGCGVKLHLSRAAKLELAE